jgi:hypothetical protein
LFCRLPYKLKFFVGQYNENDIIFSNIDDVDFQILSIVKLGFGSIKEISSLDTKEFLDIIEFININNDIERNALENASSQ